MEKVARSGIYFVKNVPDGKFFKSRAKLLFALENTGDAVKGFADFHLAERCGMVCDGRIVYVDCG